MNVPALIPVGPFTVGPRVLLCLVRSAVVAGFPSPAEDLGSKRIDLNDILLTHPQATFLFRVSGTSMKDAGINDNDLVLVNRALRPKHGHIVLAEVDNDFTVKYLHSRQGTVKLKAANPTFPDLVPKEGQTITVWGVVTSGLTIFVKS